MGFRIKEIDDGEEITIYSKESRGVRFVSDKSPDDKTPRRVICPECGVKMRRIYFKRNYVRNTGRILKKKKHSTILVKLGWWCPLCDHVIINPESYPF